MSAWEGTSLERILKAEGRDFIIETGAWTNMSIEHTARTGADKGYVMVIPEDGCSTMNADWHRASIDYAMRNVAMVTTTDEVIRVLGRNMKLPPVSTRETKLAICVTEDFWRIVTPRRGNRCLPPVF
jgi:isochorismate hydrolase